MKIDLVISGACSTEHCGQKYSLKVEGVNAQEFAALPVGSFKVQGAKILFKEGWRARSVGALPREDQWICPRCLSRQSDDAQKKRFQIKP